MWRYDPLGWLAGQIPRAVQRVRAELRWLLIESGHLPDFVLLSIGTWAASLLLLWAAGAHVWSTPPAGP